MSVRELANEKIAELIPGLQSIRQKTLPQMCLNLVAVFVGHMDV